MEPQALQNEKNPIENSLSVQVFKTFENGNFGFVSNFDSRFLIPIISADICFSETLKYNSAKVIDTCTPKIYFNSNLIYPIYPILC